MQLHTLKANHTTKKQARVGRGGKRGKTAGRGTKGQNARAGHKKRPEIRDILKKIPKLRGHGKNRSRTVRTNRIRSSIVNIAALESLFVNGDTVTPALLVQKGLINTRAGRVPNVKILGTGDLTKKLSITNCSVSVQAKSAIEKAGGSVL